ncbi:MAG: cyclase family protein [Solirubrobacterales bacterium]
MAEPYDGRGARSPRWWPSRYGVGDEIGAANELTPERTLAALALPRSGEIIELAQVLTRGTPTWPPRDFHQLIVAHQALLPMGAGATDATAFEEQASFGFHVGCHLDGLGHVGIGGRFYNGLEAADFYAPDGLRRYGIESVPPWLCRGVCLDVAAVEGVEELELGFVITPEHLEAACRRQEVEVRAGDVVLVNTGWGRHWDEASRYVQGEPGVGLAGCRWLTDRRVSAVGADNAAFEPIPAEDPELILACHQHLLAETGTFIVENIRLDRLVASGRSEFLFSMAPLRVRGATASPIAPLAVI